MPANFLAWSYSRLHSFLECPKQVWHNSVAPKGHPDRIPYVQNKHQLAGEEIDNALCARISKGVPLPAKFAQYEGMADTLARAPGNKFTQLKLALDQAFQPCGSMDWDRAWVRANLDYALINGPWMAAWDFKNGQIRVDDKQLMLYAIVSFHTFPEVEVVDTNYIWLKHGITTDKTYHRRELGDLWGEFIPDVERLQVAYKTQHWPATPDPKHCGWCNVNQQGKCPFAAVKYKGKT